MGASVASDDLNPDDSLEYHQGWFSFCWSNDFLYKTDYYYSNGLSISLDGMFMQRSPFNKILLPHTKDSQIWYGLTLVQDFFTPVDIYSDSIQYGDRPYASVIMLGNRKIIQDRIRRLEIRSEISVGIIGRFSGGQYMQNGIHWILWTSTPAAGWEHQIGTDLCINYLAGIHKEILNLKYLSLDIGLNARLGIPYTDISPAAELKLGVFNDPYINRGIRDKTWQAFIHGRFEGRFALYNATIQGGLINNDSPYTTDIIHYVYGLNTGLTISYNNLSLGIDYQWISPEFEGGLNHRWSSLRFGVGF